MALGTMRNLQLELVLHLLGMLFFLSMSTRSSMPGSGVLAATTYTLSDGDVVRCIPIKDQPSLKGLQNPTYHRRPTTKIANPKPRTVFPAKGARVAVQTFAHEVKHGCPRGTIPVTNKSLGGRQNPRAVDSYRKTVLNDTAAATNENRHEYAYGQADAIPSVYKGTEVVINIWKPYVPNSQEFSLAQLWLVGGSPLSTIEAGYQVYGLLGGDYLSRLFVYWTATDYQPGSPQSGCYDLDCPGFVQVSNKVLLRGSFKPVSNKKHRYEIKLRVFKDDRTHDWWLQLNGEYVGYWPGKLYAAVVNGFQGNAASTLQWGGEIFYVKDLDNGRHTTTDMGSGKEGAARSAYMRNLKYVNSKNRLVNAPFHVTDTSAPCYKAELGTLARHPTWGSYFYFGGPGYGPRCLTEPNV